MHQALGRGLRYSDNWDVAPALTEPTDISKVNLYTINFHLFFLIKKVAQNNKKKKKSGPTDWDK